MNKKIFIGSIIAVAVLIGVSFTSVVGYRSVASDVKASPLFNIRTNRAIDEESKGLSCDYVGNGKGSTISFPTYNNRNTQLQKVIDVVIRMDDKVFNKFMFSAIYKLQRSNAFKDEQIRDIIQEFQHMREDSNYPIDISVQYQTIGRGCLLYLIWMILTFIEEYMAYCAIASTMMNSG